MKPEPLKDKIWKWKEKAVECCQANDISGITELINEIIEDNRSAVEWLKGEIYFPKKKITHEWLCKQIDKAFEDITKQK